MIYILPGFDIDLESGEYAIYHCLTPSKPAWSIRALTGAYKGKVVAHADTVTLTGCTAHVQTKQWETIVAGLSKRGRKRNVIAWFTGKIADGANVVPAPVRVNFNFYPEHASTGVPSGVFYRTDSNAPVTTAPCVLFTTGDTGTGIAYIAGGA